MANFVRIGRKIEFLEKQLVKLATLCGPWEHSLRGRRYSFVDELKNVLYNVLYLKGDWTPTTPEEKKVIESEVLYYLEENARTRNVEGAPVRNLIDDLEYLVDYLIEWSSTYVGLCSVMQRGTVAAQRGVRRSIYRPGKPMYERSRADLLRQFEDLQSDLDALPARAPGSPRVSGSPRASAGVAGAGGPSRRMSLDRGEYKERKDSDELKYGGL